MAPTTQSEQRKLELISMIDASRDSILGAKIILDEQISAKKSTLAAAINVPARIKTSFTEKPLKSFATALASGLGASIFFRNRRKKKKLKATHHLHLPHLPKTAKRSIVAGFAITLIKPVLQRVIKQYAQQWLVQRNLVPQNTPARNLQNDSYPEKNI